jgi:hypothetical protein
MPYWVENVNGKGVVVGPFNSAPTGMNLTTLIGYPTQAQAAAAAAALAPIGNPLNIPADIGKTVANDALKPLFDAHIWERVLQVALGVLLIAIGVAKLTHAVPAATAIASKVP